MCVSRTIYLCTFVRLLFVKLAHSIKILKFKIRPVQTQSNEKLTSTRNVDLDVIDKVCIYDFSSSDCLGFGQRAFLLKSNS